MSTSTRPKDPEIEYVADLYATNFEIEGSGEQMVLGMGTLIPSIASTEPESDAEVRYHSRIRMGPGAARELYELLDSRFGEEPRTELGQ